MPLPVGSLAVALAVSSVLSLVVGAFIWGERPKSGSTAAAVGSFIVAGWAAGQTLLVVSDSIWLSRLGLSMTVVVLTVIGPVWFVFAYQYTGRREQVGRPVLLALAVEPVIYLTALATNGVHGLVFSDPRLVSRGGELVFEITQGPLWIPNYVYVYALLAWANYLLFQKFMGSRNVYRKRTLILFLDSVLLTLGHGISEAGLSPLPYSTLGPLLFLGLGFVSLLIGLSDRFVTALPLGRVLSWFSSQSRSLSPLARDVVLEEMPIGVVVIDHRNRIVDVNPMARLILNRDEERVIGKRLAEVTPLEMYEQEDAPFLEPGVTGEWTGVWVDPPEGDRRCYDAHVTELTTSDEDHAGRVALIEDVTERERRKQTLQARTEELERQNEQLESFAHIVSHDLRNPLNVAMGTLDMAAERDDPELFDRIRRSHDRMLEIIEDVLTLAKQGQTVDEAEPIKIDDLARSAWENVDTEGGRVVCDCDLIVEGDRGRLQEVFENLFRNALEHGRPEDASEVLTVTVGDLSDGFFVADDGRGIAADQRTEIMEKGFTTSDSGTGLGLSIAETIVEAHGWEIAVTESENGGAQFEIRGASRRTGIDWSPDTPNN